MKVAAIIAEYNPFHNGHSYQIKKTRELLGEDTAIIAIMSGNYTQRAEPAIFEKYTRARAALDSGINLVLELPFPYSSSSAEYFARAGTRIASKLGIIDYLVFGSECGDTDLLIQIADYTSSNEYKKELYGIDGSDELRAIGYPKAIELKLTEHFGDKIKGIFSPNNILAIEYIRALMLEKSDIKPLTLKREGAGYHATLDLSTELQSATAIRESFKRNNFSALEYIPYSAKFAFKEAISQGKLSDFSRLDSAIISYFRLNPPAPDIDIHEAMGGLYNRLCCYAVRTNSISSLVDEAYTKKYTKARIRRAILNSYFGVTSSDVCKLPEYTQILAMDSIGMSLLKELKKVTEIPLLTKPADYGNLSARGIRQKELSDRADSVYQLTLSVPNSGDFSITRSPYVKMQ